VNRTLVIYRHRLAFRMARHPIQAQSPVKRRRPPGSGECAAP
jgi:hypothetical protein